MRCCLSINPLVLHWRMVCWRYQCIKSIFLDTGNSFRLDFVVPLDTCIVYWDFFNKLVLMGGGMVSSFLCCPYLMGLFNCWQANKYMALCRWQRCVMFRLQKLRSYMGWNLYGALDSLGSYLVRDGEWVDGLELLWFLVDPTPFPPCILFFVQIDNQCENSQIPMLFLHYTRNQIEECYFL